MENTSLVHQKSPEGKKYLTRLRLQKQRCFCLSWNIFISLYVAASVTFIVVMFTHVAATTAESMYICDDAGKVTKPTLDQFNAISTNFGKESKEIAPSLRYLLGSNPLSIRIYWEGFSFQAAKSIDIAWNIAISRLGQLLLGFFTYRVIIAWLIHSMSSYPIPLSIMRETVLTGGPSWTTIYQITRLKSTSPFWKKSRYQLSIFALCLAYILAYPTLTGAMTGYRAIAESYIQVPNGDLVSMDGNSSYNVWFVIGNGSLIGLSNPTYVWVGFQGGLSGFAQPDNPVNLTAFEDMDFFGEVYRLYDDGTQDYDVFHWPDGRNITLNKNATLNIRSLIGNDQIREEDPMYIIQGYFYTYKELADRTVCVTQNGYIWGFSYNLLLLWSILNLLHTCALWISWCRLKRDRGIRSRYGTYRAAIDIATVARDIIGVDIHTMTDREIKKRLDQERVSLVAPDQNDRVFVWDGNLDYLSEKKGNAQR